MAMNERRLRVSEVRSDVFLVAAIAAMGLLTPLLIAEAGGGTGYCFKYVDGDACAASGDNVPEGPPCGHDQVPCAPRIDTNMDCFDIEDCEAGDDGCKDNWSSIWSQWCGWTERVCNANGVCVLSDPPVTGEYAPECKTLAGGPCTVPYSGGPGGGG